MIRTQKRLKLCTLLLILILGFIWGNSLMPGEISGAFSDWVRDMLAMLFPGDHSPSEGGGLLRKIAHLSEFTALGMCLCWLMGMLNRHPVLALLSGMAAACVDETIQRFVPDRGPSIWDVGIDTCGVILGILILLAGHNIMKQHNNGGN